MIQYIGKARDLILTIRGLSMLTRILSARFRHTAGHISVIIFIMRPSSLGGGRIMRRTLSVRLSVCLSVCLSVRPVIVAIGHVFSAPPASRMYFSARTEGRISYGHLGRVDSCLLRIKCVTRDTAHAHCQFCH